MLFNSYAFIFGFFPIVWLGFFALGRHSRKLALPWLAAASLFFYGWWDARFVGLLLASILFNFGAACAINMHGEASGRGRRKLLLTAAIALNLSLLAYFKYANFFVENINQVAGTAFSIGAVLLPLGISFFTFTQIAFLVDTWKGQVKEFNLMHYTLFVTYFPHLIAGPVLHHKEMMPQFGQPENARIDWNNLAVGLSIFVIGLAKKVLLADALADFSTPVFDAVRAGAQPMLFEAWVGALAYSLQLYFDFSGYSDMAIGLSLMFNVRLPLNFDSPYKATSIIEFWRRWHMSLSRFLRDYLYIPLGGGRHGKARRYLNLMATMLLGGLWHGAGWTFVVWGGLHGLYLMLNHAWQGCKQRMGWRDGGRWSKRGGAVLTFLAVLVGWVFFRADSVSSALVLLRGMAGLHGVSLPVVLEASWTRHFGAPEWLLFQGLMQRPSGYIAQAAAMLAVGFWIVWAMPNARQMFRRYRPVCEDLQAAAAADTPDAAPIRAPHGIAWRPACRHAVATGALFALALLGLSHVSEFLYFQF